MASKILYTVVAATGIAVASGAAWWYQKKPKSDASASALSAGTGGLAVIGRTPASGASSPGAARPPTVEVATVEVMKLTDDTQAVGNLKSRQSVILRPEVGGRISQLNFKDGDA